VLFSNDEIAAYINNSFEPTWVSVRAVPTVNIDFGKQQITRTLHGNIATYICTSDGMVLDIMPGAYEAQTYLERLHQFALLHRWTLDAAEPAQRLAEYHAKQRSALRSGTQPHVLVEKNGLKQNVRDFSKVARIERSVEVVLQSHLATPPQNTSELNDPFAMLAEDTRVNETIRRQTIHAKLADTTMHVATDTTHWLYCEVLDVDIDDPYLGLGKVLFDNYPFLEEDQVVAKKQP